MLTALKKNFTPSGFAGFSLADHFAKTYFSVRVLMAVVGVSLPLVLWAWSSNEYSSPKPGHSISGYYHAEFSMVGDILVGSLCGVGICLVIYRGFSFWENKLLNVAGVAIVGVALLHCGADKAPQYWLTDQKVPVGYLQGYTLHFPCAAVFFIGINLVMWTQACTTVQFAKSSRGDRFERFYKVFRWFGTGVPILVYLLLLNSGCEVFFFEAFGVWTFGIYWSVKTWELWDGQVDRDYFSTHSAYSTSPQRTSTGNL